MTAEIESDTISFALEWSSRGRKDDVWINEPDPQFDDRAESLVIAAIETDVKSNPAMVAEILFSIVMASPACYAKLVLALSDADSKALTSALRILESGDANHQAVHRATVETMGRFARHAMLADMMADDGLRESISSSLHEIRRQIS